MSDRTPAVELVVVGDAVGAEGAVAAASVARGDVETDTAGDAVQETSAPAMMSGTSLIRS
jgi:hypothetical protein